MENRNKNVDLQNADHESNTYIEIANTRLSEYGYYN